MPIFEEIQASISKFDAMPAYQPLTMLTSVNMIEKLKAAANIQEHTICTYAGITVKQSNLYPYTLDDGRIVQGVMLNHTGTIVRMLISPATDTPCPA